MAYFQKKLPLISKEAFLENAKRVKRFISSSGKRYEVVYIEKYMMTFIRKDAKNSTWEINLKQLYRAYCELDDFRTKNFKPFVPLVHSPGRGLLLHLGMLEQCT